MDPATKPAPDSGQTGYPFAAIVGQEELKLALLLNAVNPRVGGVLIRGEKGTAKSTAVRALAALLPEIELVQGGWLPLSPEEARDQGDHRFPCPTTSKVLRRSVRVVTLPLNATEDRVVGGMDFEQSVRRGARIPRPGLLAEAHRGILYVDEVNLLDDHLVDVILGVAASGENRIEREGTSLVHPARFILVGTMNPEEGELRPQLLDRFGLCVEVTSETDREARVATMERREAFDTDPLSFHALFAPQTETLARRIQLARRALPEIRLTRAIRDQMSRLCREAGVAGHRADLVLEQAARTLTAFDQQGEVNREHVLRVAPLVLRHRRRERDERPPEKKPQTPPRTPDSDPQNNSPLESDSPGKQSRHTDPQHQEQDKAASQPPKKNLGPSPETENEAGANQNGPQNPPPDPSVLERIFQIGSTFRVRTFTPAKDRVQRRGSGRRIRSRVSGMQGRSVRSTMPRGSGDIALDATLRAAAPRQRLHGGGPGLVIRPEDVREKVRERKIGGFLLFVVDASGSMGARGRMAATKGTIMSLLLDAYQKRDKVAMIAFNKAQARVLLPPTSSIDLAARLLAELPVGGRTPLNAALIRTHDLLLPQWIRNPALRPIVILVTDGRSNVSLNGGDPLAESMAAARILARDQRARFLVVDTEEQDRFQFGLARELAKNLLAGYYRTADLKAETLLQVVRAEQRRES